MTLPALYLEGLTQHALRGEEELNTYKLGLVEAILKEALHGDDEGESEPMRSAIQAALDVARWEMRPAGGVKLDRDHRG